MAIIIKIFEIIFLFFMSIQTISGLGPKTKQKLEKLNIFTSKDLLYHFPSRYLDFSLHSKISELKLNDTVTIKVKVLSFYNINTKRGMGMQKITVSDSSGKLDIIFFNQKFLQSVFKLDEQYSFAGTVTSFAGKLCLISPEYGDLHTGKIIPIYPQTAGISSKLLRKLIANTLPYSNLLDYPKPVLEKYKIDNILDSLTEIHYPKNQSNLERAKSNLALREVVELQLKSHLLKQDWDKHRLSNKLSFFQKEEKDFLNKLPFTLTPSQDTAWSEIKKDLISQKPTNRLLQGDVGSGKTVIAMLSCLLALANKTTSVVIAPTEVLALQHYNTFKQNFQEKDLQILTGSKKNKIEKNKIIITTHAIFFKKDLSLDNISLVVIDEQHKFGVSQRSFFENKNTLPHILTMTATPIPRTVNLTLLGHLNVSVLTSPPSGRLKVKTHIISTTKQNDCLKWVEKELHTNSSQAFVVAPLIETSESLEGVSSAKNIQEYIQKLLKNTTVELLHGKQKPSQKEQLMQDFKNNKFGILVSTPVIEVGVDIPNATSMIIFSPERFGLAQLHQLRGRVGRSDKQSYCFLITDKPSQRLEMFCKTTDGATLALYDLKNRGAGEVFGTLQHGFSNSMRLAKTSDLELINKAQLIVNSLLQTNYLNKNYLQSQRVALN